MKLVRKDKICNENDVDCKSCVNWLTSLNRCKFCHYEKKEKDPFTLKVNGKEYELKDLYYDGNVAKATYRRIE